MLYSFFIICTDSEHCSQVLYPKGSVLNKLIGKACVIVLGIYGITGRKEEIIAQVEWLHKDSHFLFAGINIEVCHPFYFLLLLISEYVGQDIS